MSKLSAMRPGQAGVIETVRAGAADQTHGVEAEELLRRLLEFGFVEGARIEVLHQGLFRKDPIAVRVDDTRVALRRRDADEIYVRLNEAAG
ncbi:MAG TPA: FeoA family protein [Caulobacteraceae bacterium]|nr:FeoA family protein [Caulobacteraceae bacterium]